MYHKKQSFLIAALFLFHALKLIRFTPHCRNKWQLTRVLQLFVEHVLLKHEYVVVPQVRRLHLVRNKDNVIILV